LDKFNLKLYVGDSMKEPCILIVEDENLISMDLEVTLKKYGYTNIIRCKTGSKAIECSLKCKPSLILMDIELNNSMDGIETYIEISKTMKVPIIYISGYSEKEIFRRALDTKPTCFIKKPYKEQSLIKLVNRVINKEFTNA
jgi:YesN/AraC family two-component response regulator